MNALDNKSNLICPMSTTHNPSSGCGKFINKGKNYFGQICGSFFEGVRVLCDECKAKKENQK